MCEINRDIVMTHYERFRKKCPDSPFKVYKDILEEECGIKVSDTGKAWKDYHIVDEGKYLVFILRWS